MAQKNNLWVGVDLGGTSLLAAVVDVKRGLVLGECKRKTRAEIGALGVAERLAGVVSSAIKNAGVKPKAIGGVGIGVPGPIEPEEGIVVRCANLGPTWDRFPLGATLSNLIRLPITIDNDVNVGAVGEVAFGAGRAARDVLAIFVGTGVGGGLVLDGKLRSGARNSAAEVGHMVILADGPLCGCGERGHAEALCSRLAIEREIRAAIEAGCETVIPQLLQAAGRSDPAAASQTTAAATSSSAGLTGLSASIIGDAYDSGDTVTVEAVRHAQYYLGILIASCVNLIDPKVVIVGGGVLERMGDAYLEPVRATAMQHFLNKQAADQVRIVRAALGDYSGAMGAAVLARQRLCS